MKFILAFILFAIIHTLLASDSVKSWLFATMPGMQYYYRLFYNFTAIILLGLIWFYVPVASGSVYEIPWPFNYVFHIFQLLGLAGLFWSARYFGGGMFTGIGQLKHAASHNPPSYHLDEPKTTRMVVDGPFRYVRHPLYFFSIIVLLFHPYMSIKWALFTVCCILYFWLGSKPEEKKLITRFGRQYEQYRETVPALFPVPGRKFSNHQNK